MLPLLSPRLARSGMLNGRTDWHSHILPGVDDGVQTPRESLAILARYAQLGIREVWFTPHIMEDVPNETAQLRQRFDEFQSLYDGPIKLHLCAENMMDALFEERLQRRDLLPLEGNRLLVETSYYSPPTHMDELLEAVKAAGLQPVLAHPERYEYMDQRDYERLLAGGIELQLNFLSLVGAYGPLARAKAHDLLKRQAYTLMGSDTHRLGVFEWALERRIDRKTTKRTQRIK